MEEMNKETEINKENIKDIIEESVTEDILTEEIDNNLEEIANNISYQEENLEELINEKNEIDINETETIKINEEILENVNKDILDSYNNVLTNSANTEKGFSKEIINNNEEKLNTDLNTYSA